MSAKRILWIIIASSFCGCEEVIDRSHNAYDTGLIVVESVLTNERINQRVKLSRAYQNQNEDPAPVSGAIVGITDGEGIVTLTEFPSGSGEYYTPPARAVYGKVYTLIINYNGKTYYASDSPEPVEPIPPASFEEVNGNFTLTANPSGSQPNYIEHLIDWSNTPQCAANCNARVFFYDLKTVDVNEIYKPGEEKTSFPRNSTIIRRKFSVSAAYRAYLRAMLSETRWRGSFFDVERDNIPTNLSEGATGFFAVSTVISDTVAVQ